MPRRERTQDLVLRWWHDAAVNVDVARIHEQIEYFGQKLFYDYTPTKGPHPDFHQRLDDWLQSAPDDTDKLILFQLVPWVFFIGRDEYVSLYHSAFRNHVVRWIMDKEGILCHDPDAGSKIDAALRKTWFCPMTDSMQIAEFYHANDITGADYRPDWRSLARFGKIDELKDSIRKNGFRRVVLLEDFVGSGTQIVPALNLAARLPSSISFLVLPLVVCPKGVEKGKSYERLPNFTFQAVLSLPQTTLVGKVGNSGEDPFFDSIRALAKRLFTLVSGGVPADNRRKPYGPFGWRQTGALVVMYTNTPDNTLPMIHWESRTWPSPIFPRASRV